MSGSKLGWNHPVYSTWMEIPCMFSLSGSKLLDGIFLQTLNTDKLNIQDDSIQKFEPDMK
jgi:hypothetical protein